MATKDVGHTRIRSLKCYDQLIALIQAGGTYGDGARFIKDQGEMKNLKTRSAEQAVRRFFEDHPELGVTKDPALARAIDLKYGGDPPGYIVKLRDGVEDHIDALAEMEALYEIQKDRVLEYREKETEGESVGSALRAEIKVALQMLREISGVQMDLAIVERVPARLDARVAHRKQLDVSTQLAELISGQPEVAKLLESPEAIKDMLRGELIED